MIRKKPITPEAAQLRMADLCARAEHCEHEIREKLRRLGLSYRDIEEIIDNLIEERFIDDSRFAKSFARDKMKFSGWGRLKIRQGLLLKRLDLEDIDDALDSLDEDEYEEVLERVARSKAKSLDLTEHDDRVKLYRALLSRGFESGYVSDMVKSLSQE